MSVVPPTNPQAIAGAAEEGWRLAERLAAFESFIPVLAIGFAVTLFATPIVRRIAIATDVVDRPSEARKAHRLPIAYLGGLAVFLGISAAIAFTYITGPGFFLGGDGGLSIPPVPLSVVIGLAIITAIGLIDDVGSISPRYKIGGQLLAAAALAYEDVGVRVAEGLITPLARVLNLPTYLTLRSGESPISVLELNDYAVSLPEQAKVYGEQTVGWLLEIPLSFPMIGGSPLEIDVVYWVGTAIIAVFVIGACNAANLIDGLDGLLTGVSAIAVAAILFIALGLYVSLDGERDMQRIVLCMAVLGACLGFLPHNFNPATIFLGDCGSMLLGYITIVLILTLGDSGRTDLVFAGLIIYAIPIADTALAIVRRKMQGQSFSEADNNHLHHMLFRAFGVKGAVFCLYIAGGAFAVLGVLLSETRARTVYALALVLLSYVGVWAIKVARKQQLQAESEMLASRPPMKPVRIRPRLPKRSAGRREKTEAGSPT